MRYELNLSTHTVLSYKIDINQFEEFICGSDTSLINYADVTVNDIRGWLVDMAKKKYHSSSIHRKIQALKAIFKYAQKLGEITVNPTEDIELAKIEKRLPVFIRQDAMEDILENTDPLSNDFVTVRDNLIIEMFYDTGLRRAELIDLKDYNVYFDKQEIKVHGKRDKDRIIPITALLSNKIKHYMQVRKNEVGEEYAELFVRTNGKPLYPTLVYRIVKKELADVNITKKSPHVLRHSFASAMLNNGSEINSVKELLGHESLGTTQIYTHITISELKQNYQQAHPRALKKGG